MAKKTGKRETTTVRAINPDPPPPKCPNCKSGDTAPGPVFYNTRDLMRYENHTCNRCHFNFVAFSRIPAN